MYDSEVTLAKNYLLILSKKYRCNLEDLSSFLELNPFLDRVVQRLVYEGEDT